MFRTDPRRQPGGAAATAGQRAGHAAARTAQHRGQDWDDCTALVRLAQAAAVQWGETEGPRGWWAEDGFTFIDAFVRAYEAYWEEAAVKPIGR